MSRILMCPPDFYGIEYEINPWMRRSIKSVFADARRQWWELYQTLTEQIGVRVDLMRPADGLPDMVFTANAGVVQDKTFVLSRFRHEERQGEEKHFERWFKRRGYGVKRLAQSLAFEGAGDMLRLGDDLFAGYHFRTDVRAHARVGKILDRRVISLELVDAHFYHLDTCFCPLGGPGEKGLEEFIYYPAAFDSYAQQILKSAGKKRIAVVKREARRFACNAVVVDGNAVIPAGCPKLAAALRKRGCKVHSVEMTEFIKAGGACKCLTLRLE